MDSQRDLSTVLDNRSQLQSTGVLTPIDKTSEGEMERLWMHIKDQRRYFDDFSYGNLEMWLTASLRPDTEMYAVGDNGLITLSDIVPHLSACIHYFTWGKPNPGLIHSAIKQIQALVFETKKLERLAAVIPITNQEARGMALVANFRFEGTLRHCMLIGGKYQNCDLFSILKGEYEERKARRTM